MKNQFCLTCRRLICVCSCAGLAGLLPTPSSTKPRVPTLAPPAPIVTTKGPGEFLDPHHHSDHGFEEQFDDSPLLETKVASSGSSSSATSGWIPSSRIQPQIMYGWEQNDYVPPRPVQIASLIASTPSSGSSNS